MKFPRSARIFRGHLDVAPFASVFLLLVIFVLLGSLLYTPGMRIELKGLQLPMATNELSGTDQPTIAVAVDADGRFYFENQAVTNADVLRASLKAAVKKNLPQSSVLLIEADKRVAYDHLLRLRLLASEAGIRDAWFAVLPLATPAAPPKP
jgi:biopolymer transport protein ExbD